jgi:hypothetical protein
LFVIAYLLTDLGFLAIGLCLLISPISYFGLLDRMAGINLWAKRGPAWDPNAPRWRAAGFALITFAVFMVVAPPLSAYLRSPEEFNQLYRSSHHGVSWGAMALFLFFFILGIGFLAKPLILLDKLSPRKLSDEPDVRRHLHKLQIFGGILIFISLFGISIQLVRYLQC